MNGESVKSAIVIVLLAVGVEAQNRVCLDIETNPHPGDSGLDLFTKYVNVLDCVHLYAVASVPDEKVLHAAAVAAELLDNDEDGIVDDPLIESELIANYTVMPIFNSENSTEVDEFFDNYEGCTGAVLFRNEIDPSAPGYWGSDASVEEILHTINSCGHVTVYPSAFALEPNSSLLTDAMDVARGGQFIEHPATYPEEAWYHYDDVTCEYECMAIEYLYWCMVTNMGILADEQTCRGIADEWEPCTPQLFESTDTLMYNIVTDPVYRLPQLAPDGNYCPANVATAQQTYPNSFSLHPAYPNPFNSTTRIQYSLAGQAHVSLAIYDLGGRKITVLVEEIHSAGLYVTTWDGDDSMGSEVSAGIYIVTLRAGDSLQSNKIIHLK